MSRTDEAASSPGVMLSIAASLTLCPASVRAAAHTAAKPSERPICEAQSTVTVGAETSVTGSSLGGRPARENSPASIPSSTSRTSGSNGAEAGSTGTPLSAPASPASPAR